MVKELPTITAGGNKNQKLLDLGSMSDAELAGLIQEAHQENNRRNGNRWDSATSTIYRSRWFGAFLLLCVAFFILLKADTSNIHETDDISEQSKKQTQTTNLVDNQQGEGANWLDNRLETTSDQQAGSKTTKEGGDPETPVPPATPGPTEAPPPATPSPTEAPTTPAPTDAPATPAPTEAPATPAPTEAPATPAPTEAPPPATTPAPVAVEGEFPFNKASDKAKEIAFADGTRPRVRYQYKPRSSTSWSTDTKKREELATKWGQWTLVDPKLKERPTNDFAKEYPNRDIPWDKFPTNSWQIDSDYIPKFLQESIEHVDRSIEAMLGEYGWSKFDLPDKANDDLLDRVKGTSFEIQTLNLTTDNVNQGRGRFPGNELGGWITESYFDGLKRRLMHAVITGDTFTMVMGGHSAAAGHGNHFQQSYTLQFFKVLEPVLARLGVKLHATNNGYGGLGTGQSSFAAGDLYGKEIDLYVWDSSMTENSNEAYDLFVRQGLLSGNRIPVLMHGMPDTLKHLYTTGVTEEVAMFGNGRAGVPEVTDAQQAEEIIWAARFLRCTGEMHGYCRGQEYNGTCWIDRDDYTPTKNQNKEPGGRASWHPGYKQHAIVGRIIAFTVLRALLEGLREWDDSPNQRLPIEKWHVADHYENIRRRLKAIPNAKQEEGGSYCFNWEDMNDLGLCETPFNGVGEMTPRANPRETAVRNIMKPAYNGYLPVPEENVYQPPDVFNPTMEIPEGEFDYWAVVENGIDYTEVLTFDNSPLPAGYAKTNNKLIPIGIDDIKPGLGWAADSNANPDSCDGSYDSFCGRGSENNCLLYGHNDHRGGLMFDTLSGWGVFTVPNVKKGTIFVRVEVWHHANENQITTDWDKENNGDETFSRRLSHENMTKTTTTSTTPTSGATNQKQLRSRHLAQSEPESYDLGRHDRQGERFLGGTEIADDTFFDFAVNGKITTYNKTEFFEHMKVVQRVVHILVFLNDTSVTNGEPTDIEIAMRIRGRPHFNLYYLSNIYWA